jgi:flagellar M-ring protein FliF
MKPAGGSSGFAKLMQAWSKMEPRKKTMVIVIGVALLVCIVGLQMYTRASAYVLLYPQKLSPQDVQQISLRLNEMKVGFTTDGDKVMVSPADKARVQMQLASYGLPHKEVFTSLDKEETGLTPQTQEDKRRVWTKQLEGDITEALRSIGGVADANVKIVTPDSSMFQDDAQQAKAAVMLWLQPGTKLTVSQIKGIVHYVAFSVEGLTPQSVKVVDQNGRILNDEFIASEEDGAAGTTANLPSFAIEKQMAFEKSLQAKVQKMLDDVLGPNKAQVSVSATLDFSQSETTSKTYGGPTNLSGEVVVGENTKVERYTTNGEESGTVQMGIPSGGASGKVSYLHKDVTRNKKVNEVVRKVVSTNPTVKRITASVAVDNLKPDQIGNIKSLVQGAIGYDASRGDVVNVASMPFSRSVFEGMKNEMIAGAPYTPRRQGTNSQQYLLYMALMPMAALLIVATLFFLKQRRVQVEKSSLILSSSPSTTVSDISDLLSDKMGHTASAPQTTKVNTTEQLEKLAKEKPTKVAELLKSTWLADKER